MSGLRVELDALAPAERRDLANTLLRAGSAVIEETRVLLPDILVEVGDVVLGEAA